MPLIPVIGRKQPKMRLLIALLYTALSVGAVTMVYPFVVILTVPLGAPRTGMASAVTAKSVEALQGPSVLLLLSPRTHQR